MDFCLFSFAEQIFFFSVRHSFGHNHDCYLLCFNKVYMPFSRESGIYIKVRRFQITLISSWISCLSYGLLRIILEKLDVPSIPELPQTPKALRCCLINYLQIDTSVFFSKHSYEALALTALGPAGRRLVELCLLCYLVSSIVAFLVVIGRSLAFLKKLSSLIGCEFQETLALIS